MKAIILAAGFGTRLYPLTVDLPKALLKIGKKTILDHLMLKLEMLSVIDEVILVSNGRFYRQFLDWQKTAVYVKPIHILSNRVCEHEKSRGAVRDLFLALRSGYCGSADFLVFCGDNYFDFPLGFMLLPALGHRESAFVGVYDVKDKSLAREYGVVEMDEHHKITKFEEKPANPGSTQVSTGAYFLPRSYRLRVYEYLEIEKRDPDKIGDFIAWLVGKESLYGVDFGVAWFDIGSKASYDAARKYVERKKTCVFPRMEMTR
ncbi:MAG: nucleotidyltransferase family protein [Candidatus Omnitrophota bacterium]